MPSFPQLRTERLHLRGFTLSDGSRVEHLAGAREVADTTLTIPHPYPTGTAASWIATHAEAWARSSSLAMAIWRSDCDDLIGAISLAVNKAHRHGELGYWIGVPWWGLGYATEAARALTEYGFAELGLHRIQGRHFTRNPASGRILQKLGMRLEGIQRGAFLRWDRFEDVAIYSILHPDWLAAPTALSTQSPNHRCS